MEYIYVTVTDREEDDDRIEVLINGEINGTTDETILLGSSGYVIVSVNLPEAQEQVVKVEDTTPEHPMIIEVTL